MCTSTRWEYIKNFIDTIQTPALLNYIECWDCYNIWIQYQGKTMECYLQKNTDSCNDFETNYKAYIKKKISGEGFSINKPQMKDRLNYTYFTSCGDNIQNQIRGTGESLTFDMTIGTSTVEKSLSFIDNVYIKDGFLKYFNAGWGDYFIFEVICPTGLALPTGLIAQQNITTNRYINKCYVYQTGVRQFFTEDSAFLPAGYLIKIVASNVSNTDWKATIDLKLYRETTV